jgi:glutathione-specific gamma-glutamylcyclotransferase
LFKNPNVKNDEMDSPQFLPQEGIWIFGYASLMWHPGFLYLESHPALLRGYHRALCVYSTSYRGTPKKPGLVMGLDRGGSCKGRAFLLASANVPKVMEYLYSREMDTGTYVPKFLTVKLNDGRKVKAYLFLVRREHEQYTGKLSFQETVKLVCTGVGPKGSSIEYLQNTLDHLNTMGIDEGLLHKIYEKAKKQTE